VRGRKGNSAEKRVDKRHGDRQKVDRQIDQPQAELIAGIEQDAGAEAEKIIAEADKAAQERIRAAEEQAKAVVQQAESKAEEQAERIRAQSASSLRMERRRLALMLREQSVQEVLSRVRQQLAGMIGTPEYREVLLVWIVEGAIGLGVEQAAVNASAAEREQIDKRLLQDAESKIVEMTGRKVSLTLIDGDPLIPQGVVLKAADGRVEFNNQVATRLLRRQSEIRKTIQDILAKTSSEAKWKNELSDR
jgi:vacuolar-type H+-ATPase subunit E/Vma4